MGNKVKSLEAGTIRKSLEAFCRSVNYDPDDYISLDDDGNVAQFKNPISNLVCSYVYNSINGYNMVSIMEIDQIGRWKYVYNNNSGNLIMAISPWSISVGNDCNDSVPLFIEESFKRLSGTYSANIVNKYPVPTNAAMAYPSWCKNDIRAFIGDDLNAFIDGRHAMKLVVEHDQCYVQISKLSDNMTVIMQDLEDYF